MPKEAESLNPEQSQTPRKKHRLWLWVGAGVILCIMLGVAFFVLTQVMPRSGAQQEPPVRVMAPVPEASDANSASPSKVLRSHFRPRPPLMTELCSGRYTGPYVYLIEELAHRLGYTVEWQDENFSRSLQALANTEVDIVPFMVYTDDRARFVAFSTAIAGYVRRVDRFLVRPGQEGLINSLDDLAGLRVGQLSGTAYFTKFMDQPDVNRILLGEYSDIARAFVSREIDTAIVRNREGLERELARLRFDAYTYANFFDAEDEFFYLGFPLNMSDPQLLADLDRTFLEMEEDGTIIAIYHSFGLPAPPLREIPESVWALPNNDQIE